jgi:hypothetical protein
MQRQYLYFSTSKASKQSTAHCRRRQEHQQALRSRAILCYIHPCLCCVCVRGGGGFLSSLCPLSLSLSLSLSLWQRRARERMGYACFGDCERAGVPACGQSLQRLMRQYLYFCTSKASKLSTRGSSSSSSLTLSLSQYLYFCTSKASKLSTRGSSLSSSLTLSLSAHKLRDSARETRCSAATG